MMNGLTNLWGREPAAILGTIRAVLLALLAFGIELDPEQIGAIMLALEMILTVVTRQSVVSPVTHVREVNDALNTPAPYATDLVTEEAAL